MEVYLYPLEAAKNGAGGNGSAANAAAKGGNVSAEGWMDLSVSRYRLGHESYSRKFWDEIKGNFKTPVSVKVNTIAGHERDVRLSSAQAWNHFYHPFVGKGSPEQVQVAIQLLYRFKKTVFTPSEFVSKGFIGLDCNGFVGNFIQRVVMGQDWLTQNNDKDPGPTTYMSDLLDRQGRANQVKDADGLELDEVYLLGMCRPDGSIIDPSKGAYGHIMITEPGTLERNPTNTTFQVVESCGSCGLTDNSYKVVQVDKAAYGTVFYCHRSFASKPIAVRIARLKDWVGD